MLTQWSKKYTVCKSCKLTTARHQAKGLCLRCYTKKRYNTDPRFKKQVKKNAYRWIKKHPKKWKEVYKRAQKKYREKLKSQ